MWIEMLNSRVKLKMLEATPRTFSILSKNLMKNIENHIFFLAKNEKTVENFLVRITNYSSVSNCGTCMFMFLANFVPLYALF